ncbi:ABC transporter permease [Halopelagius longus]|uniref:ABC transporter permease n=1 Tax=Halopelagius longus TaxID=1236180 RepID=UPI0015874EC0|nr:ABC transporter permease subunit [Halopelagius longus]
MGVYTVARDDFKNGAKSYLIVGIVTAFLGLTAFTFASESSIYEYPVRALWDVQKAVILVEPILVAALCYQAIVGDRTSGRIKFTMGLPNTRAEYFAGKVLARGGFVIAATVGSLVLGYVISAVAFTKPPNVLRFALFTGSTALFLVTFTSIFMAISASVDSQPAAMLASFGAYFVLVPFVLGVAPYMNLETLLGAIGDTTGTSVTQSTERLVKSLTPYPAYGGIVEPVFATVAERYEYIPQPSPSERQRLHAKTWFDLLSLVGWSLVSLLFGYLSFREKDLT